MANKSIPIIEVKNLKMHFPIRRGLFQQVVGHVKAVDDVSFAIKERETLALVGESGCGKTTIGRCLVRDYTPTEGHILYHEQLAFSANLKKIRVHMRNPGATAETDSTDIVDLTRLDTEGLKPYRQEIRMIFQDPHSSLNPRMTVFEIVAEPLIIQNLAQGSELEDRVAELLEQVGLNPVMMRRYPHAFSGGQRQRVGIARALATSPRVVVADEAVSALDVSVRAQVLNLMKDLQKSYDLTYLFISHDLSVVKYISDRIAVMYVGKIVELAPTKSLFRVPKHPYTESLLSAVPKPDPRRRSDRIILEGEVPDPANPPSGCYFHTRCPYVKERCRVEAPPLREVGESMVACHFAEDLNLRGATV